MNLRLARSSEWSLRSRKKQEKGHLLCQARRKKNRIATPSARHEVAYRPGGDTDGNEDLSQPQKKE